MEEYPQLLNLNPEDKQWLVTHKESEDRKLELRLGPPGESIGCSNNASIHGSKRAFQQTVIGTNNGEKDWLTSSSGNHCQNLSCFEKTFHMVNCTSGFSREVQKQKLQDSKPPFLQNTSTTKNLTGMAECYTPPRPASNTEKTDSSNNRIAYAPVVGWPPIRSFRKSLASSSLSKPAASESPNETLKEDRGRTLENCKKQFFVKINMEGIPIGRKVNLSAYNSYEELSFAIDKLFSGLLAAQRGSCATQSESKMEEDAAKADTGSLARSGEYTLVYEDDEGDRILVGDVPWDMFVSSVRRLRVLKSSELSTQLFRSSEEEKTPLDSAV